MDRPRRGSRSGSRSYTPSRSNSRRRSPRPRTPRKGEGKPCRIWVGGLDDRTNDEDLEDAFSKQGKIVDLKIRSTARDTFAFVEFEKHADAKRAIAEMDQTRVRGNRVKCNWASFKSSPAPASRRSSNRFQIWVGRLHEDTSESHIRRRFEEYGDIVSIQVRNRDRDRFCFIEYRDARACEDAIAEMHNRDFDGSNIIVDWSKRNQEDMGRRGRSPPRRRGRSRSRSRDRDRSGRRNTPAQGKCKCQLENLPPEMTWMDLKNLARKMRGGEEVTFARTFDDRGVPCGMLEFETRDGMKELIRHLDGKRINGHKVRISTM